ncbi:hypothetical protein ACYJ1Y_11955 [Natrialbaceae archaeon A-gly3]
MDDESVGIALVLVSAAGFGTLDIFGVLAAEKGVSIPTVLFLRFALATVILWAILGLEFLTAGLVANVLYTYPAFVVCPVAARHPDRITTAVAVVLALSLTGVALIERESA